VTQTLTGPVPVIGWDVSRDEWLAARRHGLGGSDILAILGFSNYTTPWDVWADKTGVRSWQDEGSHAADLGNDLEPWLEQQANQILGVPVAKPAHRTYRHPQHSWQMCSPDGVVADGRLAEYKTAGLASGFGAPSGWADGAVPLGYEFQVRWSLYVMDRPSAEVIALIAGMGLQRRTIVRDVPLEIELVRQVTEWYERHIVEGVEPPLGAADNAALSKLYPRSEGTVLDLTGRDADEAMEAWNAYREARERESAAKADKEKAGAVLKSLLGANDRAVVDDKTLAVWSNKKGGVDWPALVADLVERHNVPAPDPDTYRKPSTRSLSVKDA